MCLPLTYQYTTPPSSLSLHHPSLVFFVFIGTPPCLVFLSPDGMPIVSPPTVPDSEPLAPGEKSNIELDSREDAPSNTEDICCIVPSCGSCSTVRVFAVGAKDYCACFPEAPARGAALSGGNDGVLGSSAVPAASPVNGTASAVAPPPVAGANGEIGFAGVLDFASCSRLIE